MNIANSAKSFLILVGCFAATSAMSKPHVSLYEIGFGPYIGGGSISDSSTVRHTSGYAVSVERNWEIGKGFTLGPRFEMISGGMSTKISNSDLTSINSYDSSIGALGAKLAFGNGKSHTLIQGAYIVGMVGKGSTDLTINESTERTYNQNRLTDISGDYSSIELGTWIPIKGSFGVNVAMLTSTYMADFRDAKGTRTGDEIDEQGNLFALTSDVDAESSGVGKAATLTSVAVKIGLVLGF
jgi:hypothetical protein